MNSIVMSGRESRESSVGEQVGAHGGGREQAALTRLPFNSRRLKAGHLRRLAAVMEVPTAASADELRQMLEGKLEETGREAKNVQVLIPTHDPDSEFTLEDEEGEFLTVPAAHQEEPADPQPLREDEDLDPEVDILRREVEQLRTQVHTLEDSLREEKTRFRNLWRTNCQCLSEYDETIASKDAEIEELKSRLRSPSVGADSEVGVPLAVNQRVSHPVGDTHSRSGESGRSRGRRGKAPPVDPFTGEDPEIRMDDWLPSLDRARTWNEWTEEELLLQLAGHLRGRALQEWGLLDPGSKRSFELAVDALRVRLDPGSRALAAQDFRHTAQGDEEKVAEFIRRLERTFNIAYGREGMSVETRDTLLHGQLQDGLKHELMRAPAVSGAQTYKELCLAARNEEKRLAELKKRQQYKKSPQQAGRFPGKPSEGKGAPDKRPAKPEDRKCYGCGKTGHFISKCTLKKTESSGRLPAKPSSGHKTATKQVRTDKPEGAEDMEKEDPLDLLLSSSEEEDESVKQVRVQDKGSRPQGAKVILQGVPAVGIIDSGADITIVGGDLFRKVAAAARLRKRDFHRPDKIPRTYDQKPFSLDGRMNLDLTFCGTTMTTPVYVKMDAADQLLLSEGVCRQLGIISYHEEVQPLRSRGAGKSGTRKRGSEEQQMADSEQAGSAAGDTAAQSEPANVPMVWVSLIQSISLLPHQSVVARVRVGAGRLDTSPLLVEHSTELGASTGLEVEDALITPSEDGTAQLVITNPSGCSRGMEGGVVLGEALPVTEVSVHESAEETSDSSPPVDGTVRWVESDSWRREELGRRLQKSDLLTEDQNTTLFEFLRDHHTAFSLEEGERGETDLLQMEICTGDAPPRRVPARRMPFAVRQEVARQLRTMQATGVIQPSDSPWASPVVMVRKRDGSHRFCVDYRELNSVTRPDTYPLPRIDDLLDRVGDARFFSTLDLASGYWQIRVEPGSRPKTAFVTPQGLYEFRVMPFGLTNAPSVFQRLMQKVLMGLNPEDGPGFVSVYIDDVLIYSRTLQEHLDHLQLVIKRLQEAGLKLKPSKCSFVRREVEYLGHILTPEGVKTNPRLVAAVKDFPPPRNVKEVRQFQGLSSYYRRFIKGFATIAQPLNHLTRKDADFVWTSECQKSFDVLKESLSSAPVLAYPSFEKPFTLETDASIRGIGAVLSQPQGDGQLHPVAYASRSLSQAERNYSITELETLAVVWAISHFHSYLYAHSVTVYTDHTAVKAVLETPNPSGKHARWWTKVYGSGVGEVKIAYRQGKANANADALSRNPSEPAPVTGLGEAEIQVAVVTADVSDTAIPRLLESDPQSVEMKTFQQDQRDDADVREIIRFLEKEELPVEQKRARKLVAQQHLFAIVGGVLYFLDPKQQHHKRAVVPKCLREQILDDNHRSVTGGHFSGRRMYASLARHWWWEGMYSDTLKYAKGCPECAVVTGGGRVCRPPLHVIPVQRPFQLVGVDVMDLPKTTQGNKHVLVFQDYLTKWPMVYAIPDQKAVRIAEILVEQVIPFFGVPEGLLSDRGTNLLSHLMKDVCSLLGIRKVNTTAYHPECDGMVERFNRTLKAMLRKHAARFGPQWDKYLSGVLWAYRNVPHESTGEKPSYLMFGVDLRTPTEAALLPPTPLEPGSVEDYREELTLSLSSARELAVESVQRAQQRYKTVYDRKTTQRDYRIGDWVLVRFPQEEVGKNRKLSRPWHGPYRIVARNDPDVTVCKVYYPQEGNIQVHQARVVPCPDGFPGGYFWYGQRRHSPGRPPKWVQQLLSSSEQAIDSTTSSEAGKNSEPDNQSEAEESECEEEADSDCEIEQCDTESDSEELSVPAPVSPERACSRYPLRPRVKAPARL